MLISPVGVRLKGATPKANLKVRLYVRRAPRRCTQADLKVRRYDGRLYVEGIS